MGVLLFQYTAVDGEGSHIAVAGRTGLAHYSLSTKRWKLFGNETQEKDMIVTGGLLWWRQYIIAGCYRFVTYHFLIDVKKLLSTILHSRNTQKQDEAGNKLNQNSQISLGVERCNFMMKRCFSDALSISWQAAAIW